MTAATKELTRDEVFRLAHQANTIAECEQAQSALAGYHRVHPEDDSIMEVAGMLSKLKDALVAPAVEEAEEAA